MESNSSTGQTSSRSPDRTWTGSPTAASSSTRSGSAASWAPVAINWAGWWASQRWRMSAPSPVSASCGGSSARIACQTSSMDSTDSASLSIFTLSRWAATTSMRPRGHQCQGAERGGVQEDGGAGDLTAERVPEQMQPAVPAAQSSRLRQHVARQLALSVSLLTVRPL